jgi:transcriptional regulator with XRE-family HTH domain
MSSVVPFPRRDGAGELPLWRDVAGEVLREERKQRGERIADVAERAGVSGQYLSEVERGVKDPSSEILASVAGALGLSLLDLTERAGHRLRASRPQGGPVCLAA